MIILDKTITSTRLAVSKYVATVYTGLDNGGLSVYIKIMELEQIERQISSGKYINYSEVESLFTETIELIANESKEMTTENEELRAAILSKINEAMSLYEENHRNFNQTFFLALQLYNTLENLYDLLKARQGHSVLWSETGSTFTRACNVINRAACEELDLEELSKLLLALCNSIPGYFITTDHIVKEVSEKLDSLYASFDALVILN